MKEFVKKLIGRLEEYKKQWIDADYLDGIDEIIEIVNQLAEEYNQEHDDTDYANIELYAFWQKHQWIPCSERLPEEKEQERTVYDAVTLAEVDIERYTASELVNVTVRHCDSEGFFVSDDMTVDGKWVNFDGVDYEVIAWQPLPEPYQPKGE